MKFGFIVRTSPYTSQNIDSVYELAKAALDTGHDVGIFLYEDGVIAQNSKINSPNERNIAERIKELVDKGAKVVGCGLCAKFRGMSKKDIVEGTKLGGMAVLSAMVDDYDRIITFSF